MPPSSTPTARQQRLGAELRKLRERSGLTSAGAAARLGVNPTQISNIEAGRYAVSADRVRALALNYSCGDQQLIDALADMTGGRKRGWWEEYREILPMSLYNLAELEHYATALRVAVVIHLPGMLQTPAHARAIFSEAVPPLPHHEIEHRVSFRMKRQAILYGERPTPYTAIIHEAALRMGFGGSTTAREQLKHLLDMSDHEAVTLLVMPFGSAAFPGSGQPISYAFGAVPSLDTVELDSDHGCEFLDAEAQLAKYRSVLDRMQERALSVKDSRDLIARIAQET